MPLRFELSSPAIRAQRKQLGGGHRNDNAQWQLNGLTRSCIVQMYHLIEIQITNALPALSCNANTDELSVALHNWTPEKSN